MSGAGASKPGAASAAPVRLRTRNFFHASMGGDRPTECVPVVLRVPAEHLGTLGPQSADVIHDVMSLLRQHLPVLLPQALGTLAEADAAKHKKREAAAAAAALFKPDDAASSRGSKARGKGKGKGKGKGRGKRKASAPAPAVVPTGATANTFHGQLVVATVTFRQTESRYCVLTVSSRPAKRQRRPSADASVGAGSTDTAAQPAAGTEPDFVAADVSHLTVVVDVLPKQ